MGRAPRQMVESLQEPQLALEPTPDSCVAGYVWSLVVKQWELNSSANLHPLP